PLSSNREGVMKNFALCFFGGLTGAAVVAAALLYTSSEIYSLRFPADLARAISSSIPSNTPPPPRARYSLQTSGAPGVLLDSDSGQVHIMVPTETAMVLVPLTFADQTFDNKRLMDWWLAKKKAAQALGALKALHP